MEELPEFFADLGFTMKVEKPVYVFEEIEFCQSHPVMVGGVPNMVRNLTKAISGDTCSTKIRDKRTAQLHLGAVGVCGGVQTAGVPVLQAYYSALRRNGDVARAENMIRRDVEFGNYGFARNALLEDPWLNVLELPITPDTRVSFWRAFGVTPDQQVILERGFKNHLATWMVSPPDKISHLVTLSSHNSYLRSFLRNG